MRRLPYEALRDEASAKYDTLKSVPPHYLNDSGNTALEAWRHIVNVMQFAETTEELVEMLEENIGKIDNDAVARKLTAYVNSIETTEK